MTTATTAPNLTASAHAIIPLAIVAILVMMLIPVPALVLDVLITLNFTLSLIVLLVTTYILRPVEFSVFPSLLLLMTLFRLSLNVSSTRRILLNANERENAAGEVIRSFGEFVVGGNYVVGLVIFVILLAIQFIVINNGAQRISEVTARFTLDAMPGKQMSIDADLNAGLIDADEAQQRRRQISEEAEFYGAMDGAVRFTQRDAIAAMLITLINIGAGLAIGMLQHGMPLAEAARTFTTLTVGDGLVSSIPGLLISVSGGLVATRAAAQSNLGADVAAQVLLKPKPLTVGSAVLTSLAFVPGLPTFSFLLLGTACGILAYRTTRGESRKRVQHEQVVDKKRQEEHAEERTETLLLVDRLGLEVGHGLVRLANGGGRGGLVDKIKRIRREVAIELGFLVPPVRVRDDLKLAGDEYAILLKGVRIAGSKVPSDRLLAIDSGGVREQLEGTPTRDPAFNLPAIWIRESQRVRAQLRGYTVVDPISVISTHLSEVIQRHAPDLLGREEVQALLDNLAKNHPKVVQELVPDKLSLGQVQAVLRNLLAERVSVKDLATILETLADHAVATKDTLALSEAARQALSRSIVQPLATSEGELEVIAVGREVEGILASVAVGVDGQPGRTLDVRQAQDLIQRTARAVERSAGTAPQHVLLCSPAIRPTLRQLTEGLFPNLRVLSHHEIPPNTRLKTVSLLE